jgi:ATP-dependent Clp protease adaptor protein ClpS
MLSIYIRGGTRASVCTSATFLVILGKFQLRIAQTSDSPSPLGQPELEEETLTQDPAKVILFNDDIHTFDEVITQLIKATRCSEGKAEALAWEVHNTGRAAVYSGELPKCVEVSSILEEIRLMTQIEF